MLEIGSGSGFVTACLASMSRRVRTIEIFPELAELTRRNLLAFGLRDVGVIEGDALQSEGATRYDAIALTAALPLYDARFERLLTVGGRLFVVVGAAPVMDARLVRRTGENSFTTQSLFETVIDPLVNAARPPAFSF